MTTMPRKGAQVARERVGAPVALSPDDSAPYCSGGCGHDAANHRGSKCWTDALGEPIQRARTLIACDCRELTHGDRDA